MKERVNTVETERLSNRQHTTEHRQSVQPFQVVTASLIGSGIVGIIVAIVTG